MTGTSSSRFYVQMCESLGLNAAAQPFAFLKLSGKEVLYPTRGATDQLAAIHRITREIVEGPEIRDFAGTKLLFCKARATHPNGRTETSVATVPLMLTSPCQTTVLPRLIVMRCFPCETLSIRYLPPTSVYR